MASNISAAYATLDATQITFELLGQSVAPTVKTLSELPNKENAPNLPVRLLIGMDGVGEGTAMKFDTIGTGLTGGGGLMMRWKITDLMLAVPQTHTQGMKTVAASLVAYCGKYVDMARNNRNIATGISIEGLTLSAGTYEFPADSGIRYFGVMAVLDLVELI
jgi:hypothetical protein